MSMAAALGVGGTAANVSGGIFSAVSQIQAGRAANRQAKRNARRLESIAAFNHKRTRRRFGLVAQEQVAGYSSSGIDATSGSALDVVADTAREGELEAFMERYGMLERADLIRDEGRAAKKSSVIRAASTILGSTAQAGITGAQLARS